MGITPPTLEMQQGVARLEAIINVGPNVGPPMGHQPPQPAPSAPPVPAPASLASFAPPSTGVGISFSSGWSRQVTAATVPMASSVPPPAVFNPSNVAPFSEPVTAVPPMAPATPAPTASFSATNLAALAAFRAKVGARDSSGPRRGARPNAVIAPAAPAAASADDNSTTFTAPVAASLASRVAIGGKATQQNDRGEADSERSRRKTHR